MLPVSAAALLPVSSLRSKMATFTPAARSALTVASPSPEAPPVTTAARDESIFILRPSTCAGVRLLTVGPGCASRHTRATHVSHPHSGRGLFKEQILSYFSILAAAPPAACYLPQYSTERKGGRR